MQKRCNHSSGVIGVNGSPNKDPTYDALKMNGLIGVVDLLFKKDYNSSLLFNFKHTNE